MKTDHIGLNVSNIEKSRQFYCDNFGFKVIDKHDDDNISLLFLQNDNSVIELVNHKNEVYDASSNGTVNHIAFIVDDIEKTIEGIKNKNFETPKPHKFENKLIAFIKGVDGEIIELVQY